ncbi:MAG: hypothetical protein ACOX5G_10435 [Kiritimatiellia bacterium]
MLRYARRKGCKAHASTFDKRGTFEEPTGGGGGLPPFRVTVPSVDVDWAGFAGPADENGEEARFVVVPLNTNKADDIRGIKLHDPFDDDQRNDRPRFPHGKPVHPDITLHWEAGNPLALLGGTTVYTDKIEIDAGEVDWPLDYAVIPRHSAISFAIAAEGQAAEGGKAVDIVHGRVVKCFLFAVCLLAVPAFAEDSNKRPSEYWSEVLSANKFDDVLAVFQAGPKVQWPTVHSTNYADNENKALMDQEAEFRKLGELLAHRLEEYEQQLQDIPSEKFCERSELLLAMRQHLLRHPSYFNLILVDSINRVLYVNLAERLALADDVAPCLLSLVERLGSFRPNLQQVLSMTNEELNKVLVDESTYRSASSVEQLKMFWSALEPGTPLMMPRNLFNLPTFQLMKKQDIPVLLNRLVTSDLYIHTLLPALIQYRQQSEAYSPTSTYQQIKTVLGRETQAPESLGVVPFGVSRAASAVNYLLQDIQSGKTRKLLLFSEDGIMGGDPR